MGEKETYYKEYKKLCEKFGMYIGFTNTDYRLEILTEQHDELTDEMEFIRPTSKLND